MKSTNEIIRNYHQVVQFTIDTKDPTSLQEMSQQIYFEKADLEAIRSAIIELVKDTKMELKWDTGGGVKAHPLILLDDLSKILAKAFGDL